MKIRKVPPTAAWFVSVAVLVTTPYIATVPALGTVAALIVGCIALGGMLFFGGDSEEVGASTDRLDPRWFAATITVAAAAALVLRASNFHTVPVAYNGEALMFLKFAHELVTKGMHYEPFSWYAHTGLSYVMMLFFPFVGVTTDAIRLLGVVDAVVTVVAAVSFLYLAFGPTAAVAGGFLLALSPHHQFVCRVGFHHQLLVLGQAILSLGIAGVLRGAKPRRWAILGAVGSVIGFHAHYGGYGLVVVPVAFAAYLAVFHRDLPKERRNAYALMLGVIFVCLVIQILNMRNTVVWDYLGRAINFGSFVTKQTSGGSGGGTLAQLWTLVRKPSRIFELWLSVKATPFGPNLFGALTIALSLVGFADALRRFRSPLHGYLVLQVLLFVGGMTPMFMNSQYASPLIVPVMALAGWGATILARKIRIAAASARVNLQRPLQVGLAAMLVVIVVAESVRATRAAVSVDWAIQYPLDRQGAGPTVMNELKASLAAGPTYLVRTAGSDQIFAELEMLERMGPEHEYLKRIRNLAEDNLIFPAVNDDRGPVSVFSHPGSFIASITLPLMASVYEGLQIEDKPFPPAFPRLGAMVRILRIPPDVLKRHRGLRADGKVAQGVLGSEATGALTISAAVGDVASVELDGKRMSGGTGGETFGPMVAARGMHPIAIHCLKEGCEGRVRVAFHGQTPELLANHTANFPSATMALVRPHFARPVTVDERSWETYSLLSLREQGRSVVVDSKRRVWVASEREIYSIENETFLPTSTLPEAIHALYLVSDRPVALAKSGRLYQLATAGWQPALSFRCAPAHASAARGAVFVVCPDATLWKGAPADREPKELRRMTRFMSQAPQFFSGPTADYIFERGTHRLHRFAPDFAGDGEWRSIPRIGFDVNASMDVQGSMWIPEDGGSVRRFLPDGSLVVDAARGTTEVLNYRDGKPVLGLQVSIAFNGDYGAYVDSNRLQLVRRSQPPTRVLSGKEGPLQRK